MKKIMNGLNNGISYNAVKNNKTLFDFLKKIIKKEEKKEEED